MKHPLSRAVCALLLVPLLLACGDDEDPTGPGADVQGEYELVTIDGEAPPVDFTVTDAELEVEYTARIVGGRVELGASSFETGLEVETYVDGVFVPEFSGTIEETGTYTVSGSTIRFRSTDDEGEEVVVTGTLRDGEITVVETDQDLGLSAEFVYRK